MPVSSSIGYRSGFINLPPRVQLQERDCFLGSYPTIARTGDPDFLGKFDTHYDDTNTLVFSSSQFNENVRYPGILPVSYPQKLTVTPNMSSSIELNRDVVAGISDTSIYFNTGAHKMLSTASFDSPNVLSPFNESRVYLGNWNNSGSFYATGTESSLLPGFSSNLANKTQIVIHIAPHETKNVYYSTGDPSRGVYPCSSYMYYNFDLKQWEDPGTELTGANPSLVGDILDRDDTKRHKGLLAFTPSTAPNTVTLTDTPDLLKATDAMGSPTSTYGFPFAPKYDATGSQLLHMENYITHPFLLEKVVVEFSASLGATLCSLDQFGPPIKQFFLLNQFMGTSGSDRVYRQDDVTVSVATSDPLTVEYDVGYEKDLIAYGQIVLSASMGSLAFPSAYERDLSIPMPRYDGDYGASSAFRGPTTGTFRLEFDVKTSAVNDGTAPTSFLYSGRDNPSAGAGDIKQELCAWKKGGRNGLGDPSGRSYIASTIGTSKWGEMANTDLLLGYTYELVKNLTRTSPYVLMPTDHLIVGFSNPPNLFPMVMNGIRDPAFVKVAMDELALQEYNNVELSTGAGKITLFGSLIKDGEEYHELSNQPLTSDAIHEALHSDNPVVDQFQVEPVLSYTGSYIDNIVDGKAKRMTREVVGSTVAGTQGTTGSLLRGIRLIDNTERYYDTLMPKLADYFSHSKLSGTIYTPSEFKELSVNAYYFSGAFSLEQDGAETVFRADKSLPFPYEGNPQRAFVDDAFLVISSTYNDTAFEAISNYNDLKKILFTVGTQDETFDVFKTANANDSTQVISDDKFSGARGVRYGILSPTPINASMVFRYDRFGQFRDILEQRLYTKFCDIAKPGKKTADAVINIKFVDTNNNLISPAQTDSYNLSYFATSSKPYFDGVAVDRSDDPSIQTTVLITEIDDVGGGVTRG